MTRSTKWVLLMVVMLALGACRPAGPLRQITKGDEITRYDFAQGASFEEGSYGGASLRIEDGVYHIEVFQGDNVLWWGQWGDDFDDVVIDVDVEQTTERNENAFGVMCRVQGGVGQVSEIDAEMAAILTDTTPVPDSTAEATSEATAEAESTREATAEAESTAEATSEATTEATAEVTDEATAEATIDVGAGIEVAGDEDATPEATAEATEAADSGSTRTEAHVGDGYLFLIQGNGQFSIVRSRDRNLTALVDWKSSDAIRQGIGLNHLRAVCVDNYLALYINDVFVGDTTDETFATGQVGLAASAASRLGTHIEFDNLIISAPAS